MVCLARPGSPSPTETIPEYLHRSGKDINLIDTPLRAEKMWWWTCNPDHNPRQDHNLSKYSMSQIAGAHKIGCLESSLSNTLPQPMPEAHRVLPATPLAAKKAEQMKFAARKAEQVAAAVRQSAAVKYRAELVTQARLAHRSDLAQRVSNRNQARPSAPQRPPSRQLLPPMAQGNQQPATETPKASPLRVPASWASGAGARPSTTSDWASDRGEWAASMRPLDGGCHKIQVFPKSTHLSLGSLRTTTLVDRSPVQYKKSPPRPARTAYSSSDLFVPKRDLRPAVDRSASPSRCTTPAVEDIATRARRAGTPHLALAIDAPKMVQRYPLNCF